MTKNIKPAKKRNYMYINVILTFNDVNEFDDSQEFFDLNIPINTNEKSSIDFLNNKFFKRVVQKCEILKRDVTQLTKISTAGNWDLFEEVTGCSSLPDMDHPCKWWFGKDRSDLDDWEKSLVNTYGFGSKADTSWVTDGSLPPYVIAMIEKYSTNNQNIV